MTLNVLRTDFCFATSNENGDKMSLVSFSLHLVSTKTKQKVLKNLFHVCDKYEKGIKQNSRSFCNCLESVKIILMTL